jgi:hypothetical protein
MGQSRTPTFRVEYVSRGAHYPAAWPTKDAGRPSDATLKAYIEHLFASCAPGGCNDQIPNMPQEIVEARVIRQSTDKVVAEWKAVQA